MSEERTTWIETARTREDLAMTTAEYRERRVSILLVDDKKENLLALESILDGPGYHLVRALSGQEALLALLAQDFAAIVLDVKMPGMSGIELAQFIRGRKKTQHIPIVFLTAYGDENAIAGYQAGAVDFLTKPVQPAVLRSKVAVFAELFRKSSALMAEVEERRQAEERISQLNTELSERVDQLAAANAALTTAQEEERKARQRALHDSTTGLPNRDLFDDRLKHAISLAERHNWTLAVMFLDLDRFKSINDTHGHSVGDQVLKEIAKRLLRRTRHEDTVCRTGGDEFLYLLMNPKGRENIERIAGFVLRDITQPIDAGDVQVVIQSSIGIAIYPDNGLTGEELIGNADAAMYRAKRHRLGSVVFHDDKATSERSLEPAALGSLPQAVAPNELSAAEHEHRYGQLREANEHLVLAALKAEELRSDAAHERRYAQLREANEHLVLAALAAQELQAAAEEALRR